jgi:hypothetical protein
MLSLRTRRPAIRHHFENPGLVVTYPVTSLPHTGFRRGREKPLWLTAQMRRTDAVQI